MFRAVAAFLLMACLQGRAVAQVEVKGEGPVTLPTAQQLVLHSKALGRNLMIRIAPPAGPLQAGQRAAAVYMLDGNISFGMASDTLRLMALENQTWPTYLVAIGYDTSNPMEVIASRSKDYLHAVLKHPDDDKSEGGGGAAFETFVTEELKPFIEARLAIDPARSIIAGHSYGGLFVANLIARRPNSFSGYMVGSPSVWADASVVGAVAKAKGSGQAVYLGVGEKETSAAIDMVTDAARLGDALKRAGFTVTERVHQGQTHGMEPNVWMAEGFRLLLARPKT